MTSSRKKLLCTLISSGFDRPDSDLSLLPPIRAINSLLPFLYHEEGIVKKRAVTLLGRAAARLAESNMEEARNVIRRLMWNLNDESGSMGWGSPEAMGEILADHESLGREYVHILASYTRPEGNYLENELLQRGLLWAIGRVWGRCPELIRRSDPLIVPYLVSPDAAVRGLAAQLLGEFRDEKGCAPLAPLLQDDAQYELPMEEVSMTRSVKDTAREARKRIGCLDSPSPGDPLLKRPPKK